MKVTINIVDRIYEQIKEMTAFNGITVEKYVLDCTLDNFNIMKYGDLNEKIKIKEQPKEEIKIEEVKTKRKVGRPKKNKEIIEENKKEKDIEEINVLNTSQTTIKQEESIDTTNTQLQEKIKKTTRVLKTK